LELAILCPVVSRDFFDAMSPDLPILRISAKF